MSQHDDSVRIGHMLDAATLSMAWIAGVDERAFLTNLQLVAACVYQVQIIGEAASQLSPEFRQRHPEIPWRDIIGMRHRLVHGYMEVDAEIVWSALTVSVPQLFEQLLAISADTNPQC